MSAYVFSTSVQHSSSLIYDESVLMSTDTRHFDVDYLKDSMFNMEDDSNMTEPISFQNVFLNEDHGLSEFHSESALNDLFDDLIHDDDSAFQPPSSFSTSFSSSGATPSPPRHPSDESCFRTPMKRGLSSMSACPFESGDRAVSAEYKRPRTNTSTSLDYSSSRRNMHILFRGQSESDLAKINKCIRAPVQRRRRAHTESDLRDQQRYGPLDLVKLEGDARFVFSLGGSVTVTTAKKHHNAASAV